MKIKVFHVSDCKLGEGPYWCAEQNKLYWVDILNKMLFAKSLDGKFEQFNLPESLSCFYIRGWSVYGCTESGYCEFDLQTLEFKLLVEIENDLASNRSNDGRYDEDSGFIFGTMSWSGNEKTGKIYYVNTDSLEFKILDTGYYIPNGFAFNSEFSEIVIADSYIGKIYKYDYNRQNGELGNKRKIVDIGDSGCSPDGMATSRDNCFWTAVWDGACINQYDFSGQLLSSVSVPVERPTSCVFGGENDEHLFVTTATEGLTKGQLTSHSYSGSILDIDMRESLIRC